MSYFAPLHSGRFLDMKQEKVDDFSRALNQVKSDRVQVIRLEEFSDCLLRILKTVARPPATLKD